MKIETHHFGIGNDVSVVTSCSYCRHVSLPVIQAARTHATAARVATNRRSRRAWSGLSFSAIRLTLMCAPRRACSGTDKKIAAQSKYSPTAEVQEVGASKK